MAIMVKAVSQVSDLVENGVYPAKLTSIRQFANAYGPRLGFDFTLGGNGAGKTITRSTAPNFTKKSKLAELIRGLSEIEPSPIELSEGFDLETLVGSDCQVLVLQSTSKNGNVYSSVEQVFRLSVV